MSKSRPIPEWVSENLPQELADSSLFKFKITLPNRQVLDIDMLQDLDIQFDKLEGQLMYMAAQYVYWAAVMSEAKAGVAMLERKTKARRGVLVHEVITRMHAEQLKATEKQIGMLLENDDKLNNLEVELLVAQRNAGKLWHMVEAMRIKSENLRSLSGFKKQERGQQQHST